MSKCPKCGNDPVVQKLVYRSDGQNQFECPKCGYEWLNPVEVPKSCKMSKLVCKNCKSSDVIYEDYVGGTSFYRCGTCGQRGDKDKFTQQTLFDKITESPEVLAEKFVIPNDSGRGYLSIIIDEGIDGYGWYKTYKEAFSVTLERLKEVIDNGK